jgi:hypothetical protein
MMQRSRGVYTGISRHIEQVSNNSHFVNRKSEERPLFPKLPNQLRSKLSVHIERVNIHQQSPVIRMVPVFGQGESEKIYFGELIFNLTEQAGSLGLACPAPFR